MLRAMATRCCCPPLISPGNRSISSLRPTILSSSLARAGSFFPASSWMRRMFSRTVKSCRRLKNWKTYPMFSLRNEVIFLVSRDIFANEGILPPVGLSRAERQLRSVVFPTGWAKENHSFPFVNPQTHAIKRFDNASRRFVVSLEIVHVRWCH